MVTTVLDIFRCCLFNPNDTYQLRFQIEFNFRDAKQYWGLEDFMNVSETAVRNAANLYLFLVNVTALLLRHLRQQTPHARVLDLKAHFRGCKYVSETLKLLRFCRTRF